MRGWAMRGSVGRRLVRRGPVRGRCRTGCLLLLAIVCSASAVEPASAEPVGGGSHAASAAVPSARWEWPVRPPRVVGAYVAPPTPYGAGHRGIDLATAADTPVTAPSDATVRFAGHVVDRPVITLDHGDGVLSSYEPVATTLGAGDPVARGSVIGVVTSGGHCATGCLHVGVRVDGAYVSPLLFFDAVPASVLLPLGRDG